MGRFPLVIPPIPPLLVARPGISRGAAAPARAAVVEAAAAAAAIIAAGPTVAPWLATRARWLAQASPISGIDVRLAGRSRDNLSADGSFSSSSSVPPRQTPPQEAPPRLSQHDSAEPPPRLPFKFETGLALFAKSTPRPFPPPFLSPPSGSFSDPLSTHDRSRDRRSSGYVNGDLIGGLTNGDDAVYAGEHFICANDGVGQWSTRPRGHAGLWARLIAHFWARAVESEARRLGGCGCDAEHRPDPIASLQRAFEQTVEATSPPNDWHGTTTASGAQLHCRGDAPVLYVTNLGDSRVMVVRPSTGELVFKTQEQWHWFDCPRQLGTNSPDTPRSNAVLDVVDLCEGDVVLAVSDGVIDNLWEHEIVDMVCGSVRRWHESESESSHHGVGTGQMQLVAQELMEAARVVAVDPFAESPFMEHALEEGLPREGGKLDDISVVAALCRRTESQI